jgi:hypothetical protein
MLRRSSPLILVLAILPLPAVAQSGNLPPGWVALPACRQVLALRDETQTHAAALRAAGEQKARPLRNLPTFPCFPDRRGEDD